MSENRSSKKDEASELYLSNLNVQKDRTIQKLKQKILALQSYIQRNEGNHKQGWFIYVRSANN